MLPLWPPAEVVPCEVLGNQNLEAWEGHVLNTYGPFTHFARSSCTSISVCFATYMLGIWRWVEFSTWESRCRDVLHLRNLAFDLLSTDLAMHIVVEGADRGFHYYTYIYI